MKSKGFLPTVTAAQTSHKGDRQWLDGAGTQRLKGVLSRGRGCCEVTAAKSLECHAHGLDSVPQKMGSCRSRMFSSHIAFQ